MATRTSFPSPSKLRLTQSSWSPLHELVPEVPLRHGHAISIDMAYSATLANMRGILSDKDHSRILNLFSRAGLSMDHHQFDEELLDKATKAILRTRDGKLRAAVPSPLGQCVFLNDVSMEGMYAALRQHKQIMKNYPRNGEGLEAFVDASDTGYTVNDKPVENGTNAVSNGLRKLNVLNDDTAGNSAFANGHGAADGKMTNGVSNATKHAAGPGSVHGFTNGQAESAVNGVRHHSKEVKVQA
jgi:3-dehydroquinate synthase